MLFRSELTKKFEEFIRMSLSEMRGHFDLHTPRGEFCLLVAGGEEGAEAPAKELLPVEEAVLALVEAGIDKKEAIKQVALERKVPKREVYQAVLTWEQKNKRWLTSYTFLPDMESIHSLQMFFPLKLVTSSALPQKTQAQAGSYLRRMMRSLST